MVDYHTRDVLAQTIYKVWSIFGILHSVFCVLYVVAKLEEALTAQTPNILGASQLLQVPTLPFLRGCPPTEVCTASSQHDTVSDRRLEIYF